MPPPGRASGSVGVAVGAPAEPALQHGLQTRLIEGLCQVVIHPGFELGRWFLYATSSSLTSNHAVSRGLAVPVIASIVCLTIVVAVFARRAMR